MYSMLVIIIPTIWLLLLNKERDKKRKWENSSKRKLKNKKKSKNRRNSRDIKNNLEEFNNLGKIEEILTKEEKDNQSKIHTIITVEIITIITANKKAGFDQLVSPNLQTRQTNLITGKRMVDIYREHILLLVMLVAERCD